MQVSSSNAERAPFLLLWGDLSARIATLVKSRPTLLRRTCFAPAEAMHSYAAYLFFSAEAKRSDDYVAEILERSHPRDLLRAACPNVPPRLYKALARAGSQVRGREYYRRLFELSFGPLGTLLLEQGSLNEPRLDWAEAVLTADPVIHGLAHLFPNSQYQIEALDVLIRFLRASGVLSDDEIQLPPGGGIKALLRRLSRALDRITAPPRDFFLSQPFHIIDNIRELRTVGRKLEVCTGSIGAGGSHYWFEVPTYQAFFVTDEQTTMLAAVRLVGPDLWHIAEIKAGGNKRVSNQLESALRQSLVEAGVSLVSKDPCRALDTLTGYKDIYDFEGDDEEAAVAAE